MTESTDDGETKQKDSVPVEQAVKDSTTAGNALKDSETADKPGSSDAKCVSSDAPVKEKNSSRGWQESNFAPVLSKYVVQLKPDNCPIRPLKRDREDDRDNGGKKRKRVRGMEKNRRRKNKMPIDKGFCKIFAKPMGCRFGESCKFSHDIDAYLNQKLPDIPVDCPTFGRLGWCKFGLSCRAGSSHIKEKKYSGKEPVLEELESDYSNCLPRTKLREFKKTKRKDVKEAFPKASVLIKDYSIVRQLREGEQALQSVHDEDKRKEQYLELQTTIAKKMTTTAYIPPEEYGGKLTRLEPRKLDLREKLYLAPLTTVGNLPFRRLCTKLGADVTCGEMAMGDSLLNGQSSEWALVRRHSSEKVYGIQIAGGNIPRILKAGEILENNVNVDFIDINAGCPLDPVCQMGAGAGLMQRPSKFSHIARSLYSVTTKPITAKMRLGYMHKKPNADKIIKLLARDGVSAITVHGRSRQQRYRRAADWDFLKKLATQAEELDVAFIGNGDVYTYEEYYDNMKKANFTTLMIGRGAIIKPWIFTEIKERRHWDISAQERLDQFKEYCNYGLEYWGSDDYGVAKTRRFLLETMSFTCRYIPLGILERPVKISECPPKFVGRSKLETLLSSKNVNDWIRVSEMFLGPTQDGFRFVPKHKASAYRASADELTELGQLMRSEGAVV